MDQFLSDAYAPFTLALAVMVALLLLEVAALMLGLSLHGQDTDIDISTDVLTLQAHFDLAPETIPDVSQLLDASDALHAVETAPALDSASQGFAAQIGLENVPLMIWLAAMMFSFGTGGYLIQMLTGAALPIALAVALAFGGAIVFTRKFARGFARAVPRIETSATSAQFMGGLRGLVTQGTARVGAAAEVKLHDRHGNVHFIRCEPYSATDQIPEGTEVLTVRKRLGPNQWNLTILPIS